MQIHPEKVFSEVLQWICFKRTCREIGHSFKKIDEIVFFFFFFFFLVIRKMGKERFTHNLEIFFLGLLF